MDQSNIVFKLIKGDVWISSMNHILLIGVFFSMLFQWFTCCSVPHFLTIDVHTAPTITIVYILFHF